MLPSKGSNTSVDVRSCVNDDYFNLSTFANCKIQSEKKSDLGYFAFTPGKTAALYKKKKLII